MSLVHIQAGSALPKFCANCKYFKSGKYFEAACTNPSAANIDLVFGLLEPQCSEARKNHGKCGPDAKLFAGVTPAIKACAEDVATSVGDGRGPLQDALARRYSLPREGDPQDGKAASQESSG